MIVVDASAVVELVTGSALAPDIGTALAGANETLIVPHLLDIEVISALRGLAAGHRIDAHRIAEALADLAEFPALRYPHAPLLERIWELRHNFTAYDAAYIALAEATGAVLYTCDEKLSDGHRAEVLLFR